MDRRLIVWDKMFSGAAIKPLPIFSATAEVTVAIKTQQ